jgi:hypothetical protein
MKKQFLSLLFATTSTLIVAQNVAINGTGAAPNTSAMLDISSTNKGVSFPNVNLSSETDAVTITTPMTGLMVYNTNAALPCGAGLYFNNGTSAAPQWVCFTKTTRNFHAFNNAARSNVSSTTHILQPGCTFNFTIPTGQIADLKIDAVIGGNNSSTTVGVRNIVDVIIYLNGTFLPQGGWNRVSCNNTSTAGNAFFTTSLSSWANNLTAGVYTVELRTARFGGTAGETITLGGDCSLTTDCGEIHGTLYYK